MLGLDVACKGDRGGKGWYMVLGWSSKGNSGVTSQAGEKEREGRKEERVWQVEGRIQGIHLGIISIQMSLTHSPDHSAYVSCFDKAHLAAPVLLLLNTVSECTGSYVQFPRHWVPRGKFFKNKISCKGSRPGSSSISHLHFLQRQDRLYILQTFSHNKYLVHLLNCIGTNE